jgi:hypothetical protein
MIADFVKSIAIDFWKTAAEMSPFLLLGFFVAGLLSVFVSQRFIERHLGGRGIWPLLKASFLGIPLPLCSCGVIPVSVSLHKHGAGKGSTISFLLSTPQTGVDSILVTLSLLGPVFAVFRPVAALVTGIVGGLFVDLFAQPSGNGRRVSEKCTGECCAGAERSRLAKGFKYGFVTLPRDIGASMLIGLIVAALISATIPQGFFAEKLGTGILAMVVMMLLGVPIYVCATASVPVAVALIGRGVTPGAALVFLMTGPATNAAGLAAIWKTLGGRTAITYLATVAGCAMLSGILLDLVVRGVHVDIVTKPHWMLPPIVQYLCAVVLFVLLAFAVLSKKQRGEQTTA